jgi:hypothetical protein
MPSKSTTRKAKQEIREGYAPTTAAGEFVREELRHQRRGQHGSETRRQAIAIGLSQARRAGLPIRKAPASSRRPGTGASGVSRGAARSKTRAAAVRGARKAARTRSRAQTPRR